MKVVLRPAAVADFEKLIARMAKEEPEAARRFVDRVEEFCFVTLPHTPRIGASRDDIAEGLRVFSIGRIIVCYIVHDTHVDIIRIVHSSRDYRRVL